MKNKYNRTGQDTKLTKSNIPLLISYVHLYENNTTMIVMIVAHLKKNPQNLCKC